MFRSDNKGVKMRYRKWLITRKLLVLLLVLSSSVNATESLLDMYQVAIESDPQLQGAIFEHQAGAEIVTQAWAGYRPTITFDYDEVQTTQDILSSDNTVFASGKTSFPSTTISLSINQPIFRYDRYIRIGQAKEEYKKATADLDLAQQDMMLRLTEAYLTSLSAEDELGFLKVQRTSASQQLSIAQGRFNASIGREVDKYDAEARLAAIEADFAYAEIALSDSYAALYEIIGREPQILARLRAKIVLENPSPDDESHWIEKSLKYNPNLVVQRHVVNVAKKEIARQNGGHFPSLDLILRASTQETGGTLFGGGSKVGTEEILLRMSLPIYSGGSVSSKKREAIALYASARQKLEQLSREARRQSKDAYWGVVNAVRRINALSKAVTAQQATLKLRKAAFESKLETAINVLDAERDLFLAQRELSQAKYDYLLNKLKLKSLVGNLVQEDISIVNNWLIPEV